MNVAVTRTERAKDPAHLLAMDIMTSPAVVARESETVGEVAQLMLREGVKAAPIVDEAGAPLGMVTSGDLLGGDPEADRKAWQLELLAEESGAGPLRRPPAETPIRKVMSAPLIGIPPRATLKEIVEAFRTHRIKRLPVVKDGVILGVVSRSDLLSVGEHILKTHAQGDDGGGFLSFMESLIGGASLRGAAEQRPVAAPERNAVAETSRPTLSARGFRDSVRAARSATLNRKQSAERNAKLERTRKIQALLAEQLTDQQWNDLLQRAELAAVSGEQEFLLIRFPSDLCSDGGRRIDVAEAGWEETLRGEAAEIYDRWRLELKPQGFGLSARIVSYDDGVIGDIGLYLTWGE